jgi:hypothetical protein
MGTATTKVESDEGGDEDAGENEEPVRLVEVLGGGGRFDIDSVLEITSKTRIECESRKRAIAS